jgi:mannose-1-phosphate guanylyltransferase
MIKGYSKTYALIMAGGIGSRFWPSSREDNPKQFLDVTGRGKSLLRETYDRFTSRLPAENIIIVTNARYAGKVAKELPEIPSLNILGEPMRKNTAPAALFGTIRAFKSDPEARVIMAPADHLIPDIEAFFEVVDLGLDFLKGEDALITMGIKPSFPHTGYGYIHYIENEGPPFKVDRFTEKPDRESATRFLAEGQYLWNAGIFLWTARGLMNAFKKYAPNIYTSFEPLVLSEVSEWNEALFQHTFHRCENISIDYQIMEKADNVYTIPSGFRWSDVGSWSALYDINEEDKDGNIGLSGNLFSSDSSGVLIKCNPNKKVIIHGIKDLMIIEEGDILVVLPRRLDQAIKDLRERSAKHFGGDII